MHLLTHVCTHSFLQYLLNVYRAPARTWSCTQQEKLDMVSAPTSLYPNEERVACKPTVAIQCDITKRWCEPVMLRELGEGGSTRAESPSASIQVIPPEDPTYNCYFIIYFPLELSLDVYATFLSKCTSKSNRFLCSHCWVLTLGLLSPQILVFAGGKLTFPPCDKERWKTREPWYLLLASKRCRVLGQALLTVIPQRWLLLGGREASVALPTWSWHLFFLFSPRLLGWPLSSHCSSLNLNATSLERQFLTTLTKIVTSHIRPNHFLHITNYSLNTSCFLCLPH